MAIYKLHSKPFPTPLEPLCKSTSTTCKQIRKCGVSDAIDSGLSLDFQACGWLWIRMSLTAILLQHVSFSEHRQAWKWRGRSFSLIAYCVRLGGVCTSSPPSSNKKRPEIHRTLRCPRSQKEVASVFQTRIS